MQHCYLLNTVFPCLHDVWFSFCNSGLGIPSSLHQDPDPGRSAWADFLGQICFPHIHTAPSNAHTWNGVIQSFSLGLWCFPGHPGSSGKGSFLSYAAFRGSTMVSLEVLDGLMWLFPDCSNLTLHDWGLQRNSNLSTYSWRQIGNFSLKLVQIKRKAGKEGVGGTEMDWKLFWAGSVKPACESPHEECNLPQ